MLPHEARQLDRTLHACVSLVGTPCLLVSILYSRPVMSTGLPCYYHAEDALALLVLKVQSIAFSILHCLPSVFSFRYISGERILLSASCKSIIQLVTGSPSWARLPCSFYGRCESSSSCSRRRSILPADCVGRTLVTNLYTTLAVSLHANGEEP